MDYKEWLPTFKLLISIADVVRDAVLLDYLEIAHKNIWTNYYRLPLAEDGSIPLLHAWSKDTMTKMAVLHLAVTLFSNPDINLEAKDVKDDRMIQRIVGSRIGYL